MIAWEEASEGLGMQTGLPLLVVEYVVVLHFRGSLVVVRECLLQKSDPNQHPAN